MTIYLKYAIIELQTKEYSFTLLYLFFKYISSDFLELKNRRKINKKSSRKDCGHVATLQLIVKL